MQMSKSYNQDMIISPLVNNSIRKPADQSSSCSFWNGVPCFRISRYSFQCS